MMAALRRGADFVWLLDDDALVNAGTLSGLLAEYARLGGEGVRVGAVGSTLLGRREPTRVTEVGASVSLFSGALRLRHHGAEIHSLGDCTDEVEYVAAASLLTRARLPAVPTRPLPMGAWLPRGGRALVVARRGADAARWEALAARQGARLCLLACDNPHGGRPLGRARHLLGLAWGHLRGQLFLLRHPEAPALIDAACAKNYPFPFLCRRRAFWRPEGEGAALFQEDAAPPAE